MVVVAIKFVKDEFIKLYIDCPREDLLKQIYKRTDEMMKEGAIKEAQRFYRLNVKTDLSSNKVIGLSEVREFLDQNKDIDYLKEKISIKTRQYAKRQSTWARGHMKDWNKLNPVGFDKLLKKI